jgi:hypothetical protein
VNRPRHAVAGWIWAAPAVFLVHDAEEILTVEPRLRAHRTELPAVFQPFGTITERQFTLAVALLFVGVVDVAAHGVRQARRGRASLPFMLVVGALLANGLTHLGQATYFRGYTPGVVTACLLVIPYGYLLAARLLATGLVTRRNLAGAVAAGAVVQSPIAALALLAVH